MQQFIADNWPVWLWMRIVPLAIPAVVWWVVDPLPWVLSHWPNAVVFAGLLVLAWAVGWFAATIPGALLLGPLYHAQGLRNGAPYRVGEYIRVLAPRHRGRVTRVYEIWAQRGQVRVELGAGARARVEDVYSDFEVCREPTPPDQAACCQVTPRDCRSA